MVQNGKLPSTATPHKPFKKCAIAVGGIALLLGPSAGVAHADSVDWDAVAECESGGNWHADTGNGFYGGLQFKESTWKENGGVGNPADASRAQQIAVAERVLDTQGPEAWPKCGPDQSLPSQLAKFMRHPIRNGIKSLWAKITGH